MQGNSFCVEVSQWVHQFLLICGNLLPQVSANASSVIKAGSSVEPRHPAGDGCVVLPGRVFQAVTDHIDELVVIAATQLLSLIIKEPCQVQFCALLFLTVCKIVTVLP